MKTRTVTVREGELLGPVDWSYEFAADGWDRGGSLNPDVVARGVEALRAIDDGLRRGEEWQATTDCGWPRVGWGRVIAVGMYDGWPYWRPVPSVMISGPLGGEWSSWWQVTGAERVLDEQEKTSDGD